MGRRLRRGLAIAGIATVVGVPLLWVAIHRIPGFGSFLADTGRSVVGNDAIAWLEETAYAIEDRYNRAVHSGDAPEAYWEVPTVSSGPPLPPPPDAGAAWSLPPLALTNAGPVHTSWSAPGDGTWVPMVDPRHPDEPARMHKTLLHPDANRSWCAVAIVAIDLRSVDVELVAGRYEPKAETEEGKGIERPGTIPESAHATLIAAFNGGYKATHGHYGMHVGGVDLLPPKPGLCAIGKRRSGELAIATWEKIEADELQWWRQTPACMVEDGQLHPGLTVKDNLNWGATIDGETVIRRSAIGLSADRKVLFVGIGDHTTAPSIAQAMQHVGVPTIAQLDINWSYPKFVTYGPKEGGAGELVATALVSGFEYTEDEYIRKRAERDFFYLTRRSDEAIGQAQLSD